MSENTVTAEITILALDALSEKFKNHRDDYETKKRIASEAYSELEKIEGELLDLLKQAGKQKYVSEVGTVSQVHRISYKMPKDPSEKQKLFGFISEKYGEDTCLGLLTINHQSLNSFFKESAEVVPGLEAPTSQEYLAFRKSDD